MTLHHYYRETDGSLVDMSAYAPRYITTQSRAEESAVGSWSVVLDDPDGELDLAGHRQWFIEDDASESEDDIIWGGFTGAQTIARMQGDAHRVVGPLARVIQVELYDANSYLARIVMKGSDTERPAETDVERMTWLLSTDEADAIGDVTTYFGSAGPVNMDAASYRGTYFGQIIGDCAEQSGKNHFAFFQKVGASRILTIWYARDFRDIYDSEMYLTNDLDEITRALVDDGTAVVWPLSDDATMTQSPERQYCGCYMTGADAAGATYRHNATTHTLISGSQPNQHRDMTANRPLVKTLTKLKARADRVLLDVQDQDVRIKTTLSGILQERVTLCKAGMFIKVKGTHWWPSVDDWHLCRILTAEPRPFGPGIVWDIPMELQVIDPGPDGVVDGPPPPPFEGDVFAGLQRSDSDNSVGGGTGNIQWDGAYESGLEFPGWNTVDTTGPIALDEGSQPFHSITVSADMVVRIRCIGQGSGVYIPDKTVTLNVTVNSVVVGTDSAVVGGFSAWTLEVDLRDYTLAAGDVVAATGVEHWGTSGINTTFLQVGRGQFYDDMTLVFEGP